MLREEEGEEEEEEEEEEEDKRCRSGPCKFDTSAALWYQ
jgi:hypothetical protein